MPDGRPACCANRPMRRLRSDTSETTRRCNPSAASGRLGAAGTALSLRSTVRSWAGRVSGRSDRRLLLALASATDAVAAHCDLIVDRLTTQEAVTADVTGAFGEEIAQLRAEVLHLQRVVASLRGPLP